jgi:hypothetical protein
MTACTTQPRFCTHCGNRLATEERHRSQGTREAPRPMCTCDADGIERLLRFDAMTGARLDAPPVVRSWYVCPLGDDWQP